MADFKSSDGKRAAQWVAEAFAMEWCGLDPDADTVRTCCAHIAFDVLLRADVTSDGKTSATLIKLLKALAAPLKADDPIMASGGSKEAAAAQTFARLLCGFLPAHLRSLSAMIAAMSGGKSGSSPGPRKHQPDPPLSKELQELADQITSAMLPVTVGASRFPSLRKLGEQLQKHLDKLKALPCFALSLDFAAWNAQVPIEAAASEEVAALLQGAFRAANLAAPSIVKSGRDLGTVVHENFARAVGLELAWTRSDRLLVAEDEAYLPKQTEPISLEDAEAMLERSTKDYSLRALAHSRGSKGQGYVRRPGSTTSREDLVVFVDTSGLVPALSSLLDGRPELYELKPVSSVVSAVPQVTSYSWNYLLASIRLRCTFLPRVPGATLSNSLMLPASPEHRSISLPVITITELAQLGASSSGPASTADALLKIMQDLLSKSVKAGPFVAVPFMVSGLYGVIPYFVIDTKKAQQALEAVVEALVAALAAALAAYLAAKQLAESTEKVVEKIVEACLGLLLAIGIALLIVLSLPEDFVIVGAASAVGATVLLIIVASSAMKRKNPDNDPKSRREIRAYVGPIMASGMDTRQFAAWMAKSRDLFLSMWSVPPTDPTLDIDPAH